MATGTVVPVARELHRPILIAGVEKRLACANGLIAFLLVVATHLHFPWWLIAVVQYSLCHVLLMMVSRHDPQLGLVFKHATATVFRAYFPARSQVCVQYDRVVLSVVRP